MASMKVGDLLNPAPEEDALQQPTPAPATQPPKPSLAPLQTQLPMQKACKQKQAKDAPIFRKCPTKGDVLFPPHEAGDDPELGRQFEVFQIFPRGEIAEYCHHIPYSSDKKTFLTKTGRDAFEVYQYTFKMPGEEREYVVMWDYNIGLVRITPFFKCCKYSKTTPAKVLNLNPGLREITHSITGGALTAQGYWMPFNCAKAVAATFCYELRHALVPVFGKDFLDLCIHPKDAMHGSFKIDPEIIRGCVVETRKWLLRPDARCTPSSSREPSEMPGTPRSGTALPAWRRIRPGTSGTATSPESGYETGTENSAANTPHLSLQTAWSPINRPRTQTPASAQAEVTAAASLLMLASPKSQATEFNKEIPRSVSNTTTPEKKRMHEELEENGPSDPSSPTPGEPSAEKEGTAPRQADSNVAMALLQLRAHVKGCSDEHRGKRLRCGSVPAEMP